MDDLVKPVVMPKPARGREMFSKVVPTDIFEPISERKMTIPAGKGERLGKGEIYHEGYIDGKMFLVPDSNLEAMKDIINFKMRPRTSTRYKHQTSNEISGYDHFKGRLNALLDKLETLDSSSESETETENLKKKEGKKVKFESDFKREISEVKLVSVDEDQYDSVIERDKHVEPPQHTKLQADDSTTSIENDKHSLQQSTLSDQVTTLTELDDQPKPFSEYPKRYEERAENKDAIPPFKDVKSLGDHVTSEEIESEKEDTSDIKFVEETEYRYRFIISGHLKHNQTPMYIIQENSGPRILESLETDLFSSKLDKGIEVFVSGKFFNTNILEEHEGKPVALNTKSNRILIDQNKCKIQNDSFKELYKFEAADIQIRGEFVKNEVSNMATPLLALGVTKNLLDGNKMTKRPKNDAELQNAYEDELLNTNNQEPSKKRSEYVLSGSKSDSTIVLLYTPKYDSSFFKNDLQEGQIN